MDPTKKRKLDENGQADSDCGPSQLTADDARKIIDSFTHDQLFEIVQNAAVRHHDVLESVRAVADRDPARRKLFIRGLGWDTTTEKLRALFAAYGDLEEAIVILDKATGKSKGYGFVTMEHVDGALLALKEPSKKIDGRMTVTQLAAAGIQGVPVANSQQPLLDASNRKIYVANVPYDMPADRLLAHFLAYGEIEEGPLGFDKATGKSRGYALFVYKTAEAAKASLVDPIKTIDGHQMNCKLANDGKKGKPEMGAAPGGVQGPVGVPGEAQGNGIGMHQPLAIPGSLGGQYGGPGVASYGGFSGPPMGHHPLGGGPGLSTVGGGPGLSTVGSQPQSSLGGGGGYGSGLGGSYSGSHYGGPGSTVYGGLGGAGGGMVGGLGGVGSGLGGAGRGSSIYGLPTSSVGMLSSGYPESAHYSLSSSGYSSQLSHPTGTSPAPRVPPGGMYQGGSPYY
ncbi:UBP1-associated protein 2C-like [Actinidia eriantha]|uniref:UBP1-associated protein 2C-like n=1 Tax=Actinidia eriantha TaxID=165200 RepID=UPI002585DF19|nr:UBP1-associated protein 2C-like [Actinidia eriantha]XP_057506451.1 UBP1-associated protein 2C-like [Actinidia eriantha]XP_057506452.1 UBP1-associated protein 2C-like [Actinidia eriantha]XP_057506453.1 UBP1-associated protein 2C-like [Actinidia eriantha]